jgi:hypothetical protein
MHDTFAFHHTNQATKKKKKTGDTMPQTDPNTHLEVHLAGIEPASIPPRWWKADQFPLLSLRMHHSTTNSTF